MNTEENKTFDTVEDAVKELNLDKRVKYFEWTGYLCYSAKYTHPCSGCSCDCSDGYGCNHGNSGCRECGYTGKRRGSVPVAVENNKGNFIKIKPNN